MCEILSGIIIGLLTGFLTSSFVSFLYSVNFFLPNKKVISLITKNRNKPINGKMFGENTYQNGGILFFNGKNNYIDCGKFKFKIPFTITLDFSINKYNEPWASIISWNNISQPHDGIQIAFDNRVNPNLISNPDTIIARIGEAGKGDLSQNIKEIIKVREWNSLKLTSKLINNKIEFVLNINGVEKIEQKEIYSIEDKNYKLFIGKSFLNEFFNGTIKDITIKYD